jgi:putative cardiolipin synthase
LAFVGRKRRSCGFLLGSVELQGFRGALAPVVLAGLAACAQLEPRPELPVESALAAGEGSEIDRLIVSAESRHPGESAFRLLREGPEAFVIRARSAQRAGRSLDVQTYIWHGDLTGAYLAQQLLAAADRGVKVRLLVDDMDARAKNAGFAALAAHPNIGVRMFNPFASREGTMSMMGEGLTSFRRINHRMHNKTWIADNRIAVVGGRNLGDEYFGASDEVNFVDLDFAMIGPIVRDASASFDRYWNSAAAYPMETLDAEGVSAAALETLRGRFASGLADTSGSRYAQILRGDDAVQRLVSGDWPMEWSGKYLFASDDPLKATLPENDSGRSTVVSALVPMVEGMQSELTVISPYFVPGEEVTAVWIKAVGAGRRVRVLTNSLVANDVAAVHGGYVRYRKTLVEGGVQVWELKPLAGQSVESSMFGSSGASLHTKALEVDGRSLFVGSYNLDPRSTWLNCEQGVLVESPPLARQLEAIFAGQIAPEHAWQVTLVDDELRWSDGTENFDRDPKASAWQRFQAWATRVLHLDAQL